MLVCLNQNFENFDIICRCLYVCIFICSPKNHKSDMSKPWLYYTLLLYFDPFLIINSPFFLVIQVNSALHRTLQHLHSARHEDDCEPFLKKYKWYDPFYVMAAGSLYSAVSEIDILHFHKENKLRGFQHSMV